ncbi:MAG: hypothetical protein GX425_02485 [Peptococcaceae bacterium]|nr:hypothetical protein [Peptococcaceae bacterium]
MLKESILSGAREDGEVAVVSGDGVLDNILGSKKNVPLLHPYFHNSSADKFEQIGPRLG